MVAKLSLPTPIDQETYRSLCFALKGILVLPESSFFYISANFIFSEKMGKGQVCLAPGLQASSIFARGEPWLEN